MELLKEVNDRLASDFPAIANKLEDIKAVQKQKQNKELSPGLSDLRDVPASSNKQGSSTAADLQPVLDKLEEMRILLDATKSESKEDSQAKVRRTNSTALSQISNCNKKAEYREIAEPHARR